MTTRCEIQINAVIQINAALRTYRDTMAMAAAAGGFLKNAAGARRSNLAGNGKLLNGKKFQFACMKTRANDTPPRMKNFYYTPFTSQPENPLD